ncbi:hypothetical protein I6F37_44055, partial [Bradyrhizobium sp. NBAIM08]|nr:hypothetical protein [Bradyrhizobium sp. NBAIM08]
MALPGAAGADRTVPATHPGPTPPAAPTTSDAPPWPGAPAVAAAYAGPDALEETVWLEEVGKQYGFPSALVVFCDIEADGAEAKLDQHLAASDRVRGVRIRAHPQDGGGDA